MTKWIYGLGVDCETSERIMQYFKHKIVDQEGVEPDYELWQIRALGLAGIDGCGRLLGREVGIDPTDPNLEDVWVLVFHRERPDQGSYTFDDVKKVANILGVEPASAKWFIEIGAFNRMGKKKALSSKPPENPSWKDSEEKTITK